MFNDPKYIVFDEVNIVIFPNHVEHANFAFNNQFLGRPTSAGFIRNSFECYGKSVSLELESKPTDTILAKKLFRI